MGKTKTRRQKYHASAARLKQKEAGTGNAENDVEMNADITFKEPEGIADASIFKGIDIDLSKVTKDLPEPDFDTRSVITSKTFKGLNVTKKEKRQLKHDLWMKRVDALQAAKKEAKERARRRGTAVVGDLRPLEDTLPTLELLLKDTTPQYKANNREEAKPKPIKKTKQRQRDMMKDISVFQQVLKHPAFKENPAATISEHLKNKLEQEKSQT